LNPLAGDRLNDHFITILPKKHLKIIRNDSSTKGVEQMMFDLQQKEGVSYEKN